MKTRVRMCERMESTTAKTKKVVSATHGISHLSPTRCDRKTTRAEFRILENHPKKNPKNQPTNL